uniref:Tyrosine-protein phosphatase domain-containing protein n=1 Tax=Strongyloides venezuelensis TaxID=75913 RepID=A0A0K0EZC7_STRVS
MLSILYLLVAAMALVPLSIRANDPNHWKLFPPTFKDIKDGTFPIAKTTNGSSDMILAKCPRIGYKHFKKDDGFETDESMNNLTFYISNNQIPVSWIPLMKGLSGSASINCGRVNIISGVNSLTFYKWSYNVIWGNALNAEEITIKEITDTKVHPTHPKCNTSRENTFIFTNAKEGGIVKVDPYPAKLKNPYVYQMFYYFKKPSESNNDITEEPCGIFKGYSDSPQIILLSHETFSTTAVSGKIVTINTEGTHETGKTFTVQLQLENNKEFYRGERIHLTKVRYLKGGQKFIENSTKMITSNFTIKGYELINIRYDYVGRFEKESISKMYYFGPSSADLKIDNVAVPYVKGEVTGQPNCSTYFMTVGYLQEIGYNGKKYARNTTQTKEKFEESGDLFYLKSNRERQTILECIYKTPGGTITTRTNFINGTKVSAGLDANGNPIYVIDVADHMLKNEINQLKRSWYKKLVDSCGKIGAISIIIGVFLLILLCLIVPLLVIYIRILGPCMKVRKYKSMYPNVYHFWESLTNESFEDYCNSIMDKKYLSDKVTNRKVIKKIEGGEEIDVGISDLFDSTLVACYKNMPKKIKAHCIYKDIENRKYILSDALTKDTIYSFWQMIYDEDIGTIIAVIYDKKTGGNNQASNKIFWPEDKGTYEDISIKLQSSIKTNILSVFGYKFQLSKKGGAPKTIKIYHVSNWKENDIPQSDLQFFNLYEEIFKSSKHKNFLIHSSQGTGSRVYMLTYYVCMYDAILSEKILENPLFVIKKIRDKRYGGNIGAYEFAYVIKCLVTTLFKNKILIDMEKRHVDFISSYDDFLYNYMTRQAKMDPKLIEFLSYVNIIDSAKIDEYKAVFDGIGLIPQKDHPIYFKRFIEAAMARVNRKTRYADIMCLDSTALTVKGKPKEDPESFIHANKFDYLTTDGRKRKLILCQAPLAHTRNDMLDMIFRYKVSTIVVLVKPEEAEHKWIPYFPLGNEVFDSDNYTVTKSSEKAVDKNHISESEYFLDGKRGEGRFKFTILHYRGWPDKTIPSEHMSIYALYKRIVNLGFDDYIAIHCSAGIGRTGTLALIMYLIDTVNSFPTFNPLARLLSIRQNRYGAVQKFNQFVFALLVVFEHFKKQIDMMDPGAYKKLYKMAQNAFKKEMN